MYSLPFYDHMAGHGGSCLLIPDTQETRGRKVTIWGNPGKKSTRPYLKRKLKPKGLGGMVQVLECLLSKCETFSLIPSIRKKKDYWNPWYIFLERYYLTVTVHLTLSFTRYHLSVLNYYLGAGRMTQVVENLPISTRTWVQLQVPQKNNNKILCW
jgi:hypothetical protein